MNKDQFRQAYSEAIQKTALGFFVLEHLGPDQGLTPQQIKEDQEMMARVLANGVGVPLESVLQDIAGVPQAPFKQVLKQLPTHR